jgi:Fe-S cluster assembly protein SufB
MTDIRNREAQDAVDRASNYEWGFSSDIEQDFAPKGLNETRSLHLAPRRTSPNGCWNGASSLSAG